MTKAVKNTCSNTRNDAISDLAHLRVPQAAAELAQAQRDSEAPSCVGTVMCGHRGGAEGVVCPYSSLRAAFEKKEKRQHFHLVHTPHTHSHTHTDTQTDRHRQKRQTRTLDPIV